MDSTPRLSLLFPYATLFRSWVAAFFMFLSGASFALVFAALRNGSIRTFFRDPEFRFYTGLMFIYLTITDRKSTRLNSSHVRTSYAVFCLQKKKEARKSTRLH